MGNADDDAELTADWHSRQPTPPPGGPQPGPPPYQSGPPPGQPFSTPASPFSTPPGQPWTPPAGAPPPGAWPAAGYGPGAPAPGPAKKTNAALIVGVVVVIVLALAGAGYYVLRGRGEDTTTTADSATSSTASPTESAGSGAAPSTTTRTSRTPRTSAAAPTTSSAAPTVSDTNLASLLVPTADMPKYADQNAMTPSAVVSAPFTGVTVDPSTCTSAVSPGDATLYSGSGYTGFAAQNAIDDSKDHKLIQAIAAFPTDADAKAFYDAQVTAWRGCRYVDLTSTYNGQTSQAKSGITAETDGTAHLVLFTASSGQKGCEHAITARKNLIVDVRVCAPSIGSQGFTLARDIGQKITGTR